MTLLVDNQLPLALARFLAANGFDCQHVQDIGLDTVVDSVIWAMRKKTARPSSPNRPVDPRRSRVRCSELLGGALVA